MLKQTFFLFFFLSTFFCLAQQDSLYTDTVIVVEPPVVIEKSVHVTIGEEPSQRSPWELGAYFTLYQNMSLSSEINTTGLLALGGQIRYTMQHFQIGMGMGLLSGTASGPVTSNVDQIVQKEKTVEEGTECYTDYLPDGTNREVCNPITNQVQVDTTIRSEVFHEQKVSLQYLQIPLSVGYVFSKNKWQLTPSLQIAYNKNVSKVLHQLPIKDEFWMAGGQLSLGYAITPHLLVELKGQYQSSLSDVYTTEGQGNWQLLGLGLGAYWRF